MAIKAIAFNLARKWQSCRQTVWLQKVTMVGKSYELLCLLLLWTVVVLPIVTVASSVLVAAVSAKHTILAIANSSMANRMLVGVMLLNVVCGNAAAK